nr:hypothetical protein [Desulfobacula sp.]
MMRHLPGKSGFFPVFVMASFGLTLPAGLLGTLLPSLDYLPVIGRTGFSPAPWQEFFAYPGIQTAIRVTLISGITACLCAVGLSVLWICCAYGSRSWRVFEKALSPLLSLPHAAFAIGFGLLISPSGWFIRLVSPGLTGFSSPPDWILLNDPHGFSLAAALAIKEIPFLVMVMISATGQLDVEKTLLAGRALGYTKEQIWVKILIPRLYPHLRLSVFAVIAYSFSVVDMALILGPGSPPSLAVQILKWFNDPDLSLKPVAACGSLVLFFSDRPGHILGLSCGKGPGIFFSPLGCQRLPRFHPHTAEARVFTAGPRRSFFYRPVNPPSCDLVPYPAMAVPGCASGLLVFKILGKGPCFIFSLPYDHPLDRGRGCLGRPYAGRRMSGA